MFNFMEFSIVKKFINFDGITQTNNSVKEEHYYILTTVSIIKDVHSCLLQTMLYFCLCYQKENVHAQFYEGHKQSYNFCDLRRLLFQPPTYHQWDFYI